MRNQLRKAIFKILKSSKMLFQIIKPYNLQAMHPKNNSYSYNNRSNNNNSSSSSRKKKKKGSKVKTI